MNNDLAPTYQRLFGQYWVLWYSTSNNYSIVKSEFKSLLDLYLKSNSLDEFGSKISSVEHVSNLITITNNLKTYLESCNASNTSSLEDSAEFNHSNSNITKYYSVNDKLITVNYDTELVKNTIHPALAHLEINKNNIDAQITFDIYLNKGQLSLFKNQQLITSVPQRDYHLLQGKFIMQLLCVMHDKKESDWVGTFHGSTISDGTNTILFIGNSGKGKSTLCALLSANGYELLADDVSPMLAKDGHIYHNPSAISIKEGAFSVLQPLITDFENLPITVFNKNKGPLRYLPCDHPKKDNYPCKAIIMVNYEADAKTNVEPASIKTILETLIPDSWLSRHPLHAEQFLDWLKTVHLYQLTYSDTDSVITELSTIFNEFKSN
ncbi:MULTISPECIES: hypothetical protein [Winogradskyella]|uniref:HprK-related kinase B n=1 Tax=Winogradskyella ouciana TaxID=2608631 RepID=A0A7K1GF73_9FLAO|nr:MULTISPECIES: hypothetical protein [Winogradskyella]MBO6881108.1 hypothetical protein [Winogradskyella sp.]MTE26529.1 hypothetical protein [Winogradskyella ouciana]